MNDSLKQALEDAEAILFTGLDDAIIGIGQQYPGNHVAVYDRALCINILMKDGGAYEGAEEYFEHNVACAALGPKTPIIIWRGVEE
jgi:hypothetical protein